MVTVSMSSPQDVVAFSSSLPRLPSELDLVIIRKLVTNETGIFVSIEVW